MDLEMPWFRLYDDLVDDDRLKRIARETGMPKYEVLGFWTAILCLANESPLRGKLYLTYQVPFIEEDVADTCGCTVDLARMLLEKFIQLEMLNLEGEAWVVIGWDKMQFVSDRSTARVRKFREKQRQARLNASQEEEKVESASEGERSGNVLETEAETETEAEEEGDLLPPPLPLAGEGGSGDEAKREQGVSEPRSEKFAYPYPENPAEASLDPFLRVAIEATGAYPPQAEYKNTVDTVMLLYKSHPERDELVDYLRRFWVAWKGRKNKNGNAYKSGNMAWLYEWAVNGEIPPENNGGVEDEEERLRKMRREVYGKG